MDIGGGERLLRWQKQSSPLLPAPEHCTVRENKNWGLPGILVVDVRNHNKLWAYLRISQSLHIKTDRFILSSTVPFVVWLNLHYAATVFSCERSPAIPRFVVMVIVIAVIVDCDGICSLWCVYSLAALKLIDWTKQCRGTGITSVRNLNPCLTQSKSPLNIFLQQGLWSLITIAVIVFTIFLSFYLQFKIIQILLFCRPSYHCVIWLTF